MQERLVKKGGTEFRNRRANTKTDNRPAVLKFLQVDISARAHNVLIRVLGSAQVQIVETEFVEPIEACITSDGEVHAGILPHVIEALKKRG